MCLYICQFSNNSTPYYKDYCVKVTYHICMVEPLEEYISFIMVKHSQKQLVLYISISYKRKYPFRNNNNHIGSALFSLS